MPAVAVPEKHMPVRVEKAPGLGRVLVACRPFDVGDEILCEAPLLRWPMGDWDAYLDALLAAEASVRAAVLDLFRPDLDSAKAKVAATRARAESLLAQRAPHAGVDLEFVHAALLVAELNAHAFSAGKEMAMFDLASKAAHSCAPNAAYSSRDVPGHLRYKAIRPIAAGEQVQFSYIAGLYSTPTEGRRAELENTKDFICHCARCDSPDPLRGCRCPTNDCSGIVMPKGDTDEPYDLPSNWVCSRGECGPISEEDLEAHFNAEEATNDAMQAAGGAALSNIDLEMPGDLEACVNRLPRVHTISIQGFKLLGTVLAVRADDAKEQGDNRALSLRLRAAAAKLDGVRAMECVAARCDGQCEPSEVHPVVYQLCLDVLEAGKDLALSLASDTEAVEPLARHVGRYVPSMLVMWPHLSSDKAMMATLNSVRAVAAD